MSRAREESSAGVLLWLRLDGRGRGIGERKEAWRRRG